MFLDYTPSHPNESFQASDDGLITRKLLPPNVTALIQPMDQGVILSMKRLYRSDLLKNLMREVITLPNLNICYWMQIWNISSMVKGKIIYVITIMEKDQEIERKKAKEIEGFENLEEENLEDWFQSGAFGPSFQYLFDEGIITNCLIKSNSDDNTDAEDVLNEGNTIPHLAALKSVETLVHFVGQRGFDYGDITAVCKICTNIQQEMNKQQKQRHITHFFKQ